MGKIFYIMGKSASGKDTIYKRLTEYYGKEMKRIIGYTTRPIREGEKDGVEYFFITEDDVSRLKDENKIIEMREYQTVMGPWKYLTVNDEQIDLTNDSYLVIGTLESYLSMIDYMGKEALVPIYITVDDEIRRERAMHREALEAKPNYEEVHRRFEADNADFSEEKLKQAGIERCFNNLHLEETVGEIIAYIEKTRGAFLGSF